MLITFKSRAAGDVLMLGKTGQHMLTLISKDTDATQGIITVAQLPAAITALSEALAADRAASRQTDEDEEDEDAPRGMAAPVMLAQRIAPLLELCRYALRDEEPVIWEAT